ncbi:hypothetical protein BH10PLA1_BH10PLA1_22380 [soil metagenome]
MIGTFIQDEFGNADAAMCDVLLERLKENGVLAGKTGPGRNTLTFMPPLTVSDGEIDYFMLALRKTIEETQQPH